MTNLTVVGQWVNGEFIPKRPGHHKMASNDVVLSESGVISRLVEDGRTGRLQLWGVSPGMDLGMPNIVAGMRIVGQWVNGEFIPSDEPEIRQLAANDVVESGGEYYRVVDTGTKFQLWKVTADVVTCAFFGQVHSLDWSDLMAEARGGLKR